MRTRNKFKTTLLALCLGMSSIGTAGAESGVSYATYAETLSTYVDAHGLVDYAGLNANRSTLDTFVQTLAQLDPNDVKAWDRNARFALWMNAYNALTLKAVLDHYPVDSIRDIGNVVKSVWNKLEFNVMGRTLTLNQIEHEILRKEFKDARLHMAINCASIGCPPLGNEPLQADRLDEQFTDLTRRFLTDPAKFNIDTRKGNVYLSPLFKWFGDDFVAAYTPQKRRKGFNDAENGVLNFIAGHLEEADRSFLNEESFKIKYLDYDWDLNQQ